MVAAIIIVATTIFVINPTGNCLTIRDGKTGEILAGYPFEEGGEFSVRFMHSVNLSPVEDKYRIENGGIVVFETVYYAFGAGVQSQLEDGQILTMGDNGEMIISGIDTPISELTYNISPVYDHVLILGEKEISLKELCKDVRTITFVYE